MYRFWAFPNGMDMLPRMAATVCRTTTGTIRSLLFAILRTSIANGTKVSSATSLVMNMAQKNGSSTSRRQSTLTLLSPPRMRWARILNTLHFLRPATTAMKQNRMHRVRTSM